MTAFLHPHSTALAVALVLAVIAMVAWALQLMQAASDRREFSLMLAGCMVCSAAVGLAAVMVISFTSADRLQAQGVISRSAAGDYELAAGGVSLDAITLPWDAANEPPT
ncbi:MAG: hypothetical protein RLZZ516_1746 [Cyanobacteriota bacterium]|nr:hypothetical protein [Synechococcaceae bacterium WB4_1_0192]